ncbi:hypothetical protein, partial [Lactococcus garvieae]
HVKIKSVNIKDERNLVLLFLYIGGRMSRTGITVDKKMIDAEGISNFYSIKVSTARNKICEMKKDKRFMQGDYFRMSGRVWFPAFDEFLKIKDEEKYR